MLQLRKGERLFLKGTPATQVFMVLKGHVRLIAKGKTPEICGPKRWLFESAHELGHVYLQSAYALTDCAVFAVDRELFSDMLRQHPALNIKFLEDVAERVGEKGNSNEPADRRLARRLLSMLDGKDKIIETSPSRLAILIGTSRVTTTNLVRKFVALGMMTKMEKNRYRLHKEPLERFLLPRNGDSE